MLGLFNSTISTIEVGVVRDGMIIWKKLVVA
jgi:hypothetical protein